MHQWKNSNIIQKTKKFSNICPIKFRPLLEVTLDPLAFKGSASASLCSKWMTASASPILTSPWLLLTHVFCISTPLFCGLAFHLSPSFLALLCTISEFLQKRSSFCKFIYCTKGGRVPTLGFLTWNSLEVTAFVTHWSSDLMTRLHAVVTWMQSSVNKELFSSILFNVSLLYTNCSSGFCAAWALWLSALSNKNTGLPFKFEFQMSTAYFFSI